MKLVHMGNYIVTGSGAENGRMRFSCRSDDRSEVILIFTSSLGIFHLTQLRAHKQSRSYVYNYYES